ncbi:MAG: hypothetical protein NTV54_02895, partial [Ignavibacteriales bacterium]|nr:hypothetical protein [Ignavibacteriales bacterium]
MQFLFFGNTSYSSASQREHAFARTLAERGYLVAFVEGMPSLASRVRSRLRRVIATESVDEHPQRKKHPVQNLTVHVPPTVPSFFRSSWVPGLDAWLFRRWFRKQFRNQNWNDTIVMVMFPYWWYGFVDKSLCPAKMFIYDICDALEMPSRNSIALRRMRMAEKKLMRDVALVTYSAFEMRTEIAKDSPSNKLLCLPNAISVFFADSMRRSSTPNRLPTIGYVGFLDPRWADRELLVRMAASFPAYRIVLRSSMDKSFSR